MATVFQYRCIWQKNIFHVAVSGFQPALLLLAKHLYFRSRAVLIAKEFRSIFRTIFTMDNLTKVQETSRLFPNRLAKPIAYGTAGFREKSSDLPHIVFRMGQLSAICSQTHDGKFIGVMITASHNPEEDNGVKLCGPKGEMLNSTWETFATELANAEDDQLSSVLQDIINKNEVNLDIPANLVLGYDTRPSSLDLADAFLKGAALVKANVKNFGLLTTPQLHYLVHCINTSGQYGEPTEEGYYTKLSTAFRKLCQQNPVKNNYTPDIKVDGANGVGALKLKAISKYLGNDLEIQIFNDGPPGKLNHLCGADYVKIQQQTPKGFPVEIGTRCVSVDGDGDRVVYFYTDSNNVFHLLDGDKISTLITDFLLGMAKETGLKLDICVVQTAYANGSSTKYMENTLNIPVACVPTGVKHLHHRAEQADIGVYFEANGHGTVLFSESATEQIKVVAINASDDKRTQAAKTLLTIIDIINQTVGDAISDILLVEIILCLRGWSVSDWDALYNDFPNRQLKVKVGDRNLVTTTDAERRCVTPVHLQDAIDSITKDKPNWRAFVRPSGTEDIVRVYAEADTQGEADELAYQVSQKVYELAGGVGPEPSRP